MPDEIQTPVADGGGENSSAVLTAEFDLERAATDERTVPVVVSSERPVRRGTMDEILVHDARAVDLSRAPLPLIEGHEANRPALGVIENLRIEGGRLRGDARFGTSARAEELLRDIRARIVRGLSVGATILKYSIEGDKFYALRWRPFEASIVGVPADEAAGFYRSETAAGAAETSPMKEGIMSDEKTAAAGASAEGKTNGAATGAANGGGQAAHATTVRVEGGVDVMAIERERHQTIDNLVRANNLDERIGQEWKRAGTSYPEISRQIVEIQKQRAEAEAKSPSDLGLSKREVENYSLFRAINAIAQGGKWDNAGLEHEAHRSIFDRLGAPKDAINPLNCIYVPLEVQGAIARRAALQALATRRDFNTSTGGGANLIETQNVGFIEFMRNRSVFFSMGAVRLPGLTGSITVPRQSAAGSTAWLSSETGGPTETNPTIVQMSLTPKTVAGYTEISRQLLLQSNPSAENIVTDDLAKGVALAVDAAGFNGAGANGEPQGLIGGSGLTGVGAWTGASLSYTNLLNSQTDLAVANLLSANCGYASDPASTAIMMSKTKAANDWSPLWEGNMLDGTVVGYHAMTSNQVPGGRVTFGDFSTVVIAEWGTLAVEVNPYAGFSAGIIGVRAMYTVDIGFRYPAAFSISASLTA